MNDVQCVLLENFLLKYLGHMAEAIHLLTVT